MNIGQLLKVLKTDYIEVAAANDPYASIEYLRRDELLSNADLVAQPVTAIEPLAALKKSLFDSSAGDSDYVASIKILYGEENVVEEEEEVIYRQEPEPEAQAANPFLNFGGFGGMKIPDLEQMRAIINSEAFENFMNSGFMESILNSNMTDLYSGIDLSEILGNLPSKDDSNDEDDDTE